MAIPGGWHSVSPGRAGKIYRYVGNPQQSGMSMMNRVEGGTLWSNHQSPGGSCQEVYIFIWGQVGAQPCFF